MKLGILVVLLTFCFSISILGQNVYTHYMIPNIELDKNPICIGETVTITIKSCTYLSMEGIPHGTGFPSIYNQVYYGPQDCDPKIKPQINLNSSDIISIDFKQNTVGPYECGDITGILTVKLKPTQSKTYNIDWEVQLNYPNSPPGGLDIEKYVTKNSDFRIEVIDLKKTSVKASKGLILSNETSLLTATGCNIGSNYQWKKEECIDSDWTMTGNPINVGAGTYRARCFQQGCVGEPSDPINILLDTPPPSALGCSNSEAEGIYNFTRNGDDYTNDYHHYNVVTSICKKSSGNSKCTVEEVWAKLKSSAWNNAPLAGDFVPKVGNMLPVIFSKAIFASPEVPVANCGLVNLPSPMSIAVTFILFRRYDRVFKNLLESYLSNPPYSPDVIANPIVQTIDEGSRSITNFTMPGHILYPGRVVRTVIEECGEVKIKTVGIGKSWATKYNNTVGGVAGQINTYYGPWLFENVDARVKNSF